MADRREKVTLEIQDAGFSTGMIRAAGATGLLERALKSLDGTSVVIHERVSESAVQVDRLSKSSRDADTSINQLTGRLALFADAAAILGPSLIPISAVALPAVTGLAAQFGFAATGALGFVVAVQGLGDAIGAMNKAHLEPTTDNLAAARLEMEKLSPAGQDLASQIFGLRDEWRQLRDVSQGALFAGLSSALDDLETRLPDFERVLVNVNRAVGDMLADGAESLASPRWDEFFEFIATDAPPAIATMGQALGNVASAMARLWMAFDPLNDSFALWLVDSTAALDRWADGLSETQAFQDFIDYIRESGPQVAETLGALANAVLQIVEAAAPLGGPVLQALEGVGDAIATIAGSDAGPAIMATVTALALLRRGMATFERVSATSWVQNIKGAETFGTRVAAARNPLLKTSAALAGIAIASSDTAQGFGLANAASGALLGTMAGPWGAAIGGAVGLMIDLTSSTGGFEVNAQSLTETLDQQTGAITENTTAFAANELEKQGVLKAANALGLSLADVTQASLGNAEAQERVNAALKAARDAFGEGDTSEVFAFDEDAQLVTSAIGEMSGALEVGQGRIRRMADATDVSTGALQRAEQAAQDFSDAVTRLNNVLERRATVRDYEAAVDDLAASIKDNGRNFDINTEKGRNNQAALDNVATTAIRLAENLKGAARQKVLTAAIADLRDAGQKFGIPQSEIKKLIGLLKDANNTRVNPKIDVETSPAMNNINGLEARLRAIKDESVNVVVRTINTGDTQLGPRNKAADGATVPKTGKPYADRHLYLLADGEEVISNRHGQADRHRSLLKSINAGRRLADGGTAGDDDEDGGKKKRRRRNYFDVTDNTKALQASIDRLTEKSVDQTAAVEAQRYALEQATESTEMWADRMSDLAKATVSGFNTGLFERDSNVWAAGSGGGPISNLTGDIAGLEERAGLQAQLAGMGLSGDALAALLSEGDNADIQALIASGQVSQYADLFNQRAALQGSVGAAAGQQAYGQEYAAARAYEQKQFAELQAQTAVAARTEARIGGLEAQVARTAAAVERLNNEGPAATGREVGKVINEGAASAHREGRWRNG